MALSIDIIITDYKIKLNFSSGAGRRYTFSRERYKAEFNDRKGITFSQNGSEKGLFTIEDIEDINIVTDYRNGEISIVEVPSTIEEFYDNVVESNTAPFFFESVKVDAAEPVQTTVQNNSENPVITSIGGSSTTESGAVLVQENSNSTTSTMLKSILEQQIETNKLLKKIYNPE